MAKQQKAGHLGALLFIAAGTAAVAAGSYFFSSKKGAKRRDDFRAWTVKAKGEVLEKIEALSDIDAETYADIVDSVTAQYKKLKKATPEEIVVFGEELKSHWKSIVKEARAATLAAAKRVEAKKKKPAKKSAATSK